MQVIYTEITFENNHKSNVHDQTEKWPMMWCSMNSFERAFNEIETSIIQRINHICPLNYWMTWKMYTLNVVSYFQSFKDNKSDEEVELKHKEREKQWKSYRDIYAVIVEWIF